MTAGSGSDRGAAAVARLTVVCQGSTAATRAVRFPAAADPLDPHGSDALARLRARLGWRAQAGAAPSRAARDSAAALAVSVVAEPALRDCDYGAWTGRPMAAAAADDPGGFAAWLRDPDAAPPGGESLTAVLGRLRAWLGDRGAAPGSRLVVAPPYIVRALAVAALDLPAPAFWRLDAAPLGVSRLSAEAGRWRLAAFNAAVGRAGDAG